MWAPKERVDGEKRRSEGPGLGHANIRGQDGEEPVRRTEKERPVNRRRRAQGAGTWEPRGEGIAARRACQLCQVMINQVNWGLNTDHQDWQLSVTQTTIGGA